MIAGVKPNNVVINTIFDCSLSQLHLTEIVAALKHQEYSHTFYRVTDPKYVHHLQNGELLSLLTVPSHC